jgi:hypothetical protein
VGDGAPAGVAGARGCTTLASANPRSADDLNSTSSVTDATRRPRRRRPFDEIELHGIPVLFGAGRRLFEGLPAEQIELEPSRVLVADGGVTHLHYRVRR